MGDGTTLYSTLYHALYMALERLSWQQLVTLALGRRRHRLPRQSLLLPAERFRVRVVEEGCDLLEAQMHSLGQVKVQPQTSDGAEACIDEEGAVAGVSDWLL